MPFLTPPPGLNMNGSYQRDSRTPPRLSMGALANEYQAMIENERRRHEFVEVQLHAADCSNKVLTLAEPNACYSDPHFGKG